MVSGIIHHQNHSFRRVLLDQQLFQKADEGSAVFGLGGRPGEGVFQPVVTAKDVPFLLFTRPRGWNSLLLPDPHPTRAQHRVEGYGCFVHKDEFEIVSEDLFFNSSSISAALALASLSCKCPRSYFGRRYRYPLRFINARSRLSLRSMPVSFSRCARKRSMVQIVKSYPASDGSWSIAFSNAAVYASSAFSGRPLLGRLANPSTPSLRQRSYQPYTVGLLIACILAISSGLYPKCKRRMIVHLCRTSGRLSRRMAASTSASSCSVRW
jgi:hypothetical protein